MEALRVERPEIIARATENIGEMVTLIERLASEDIAYKAEDGSWYFRIAKFPDYGKLSGKDLEGMEDGARVDVGRVREGCRPRLRPVEGRQAGRARLGYGAGHGSPRLAH